MTHLLVLLGRLSAELPPLERDPDRVDGVVHRVLARPEYRRPARSLLSRIREDVVDWLARVLSAVVGAGIGAWIVLAVVVTVVVLVAVRVVRDVSPDPGMGVTVRAARTKSAGEWRAEAEAHEQAGQWRDALRCRYRALIADLAGRGLVDDVPGRTAGEYRRELGDALPSVAPQFRGATELFETAWYGRRPTGRADAARFRELADRVLEMAP